MCNFLCTIKSCLCHTFQILCLQFIPLPWLTIRTKCSAEILVSALPSVFEKTTADEERTRTVKPGVSRWVNEKDVLHQILLFVDGTRHKVCQYIHLLICSFFL